MPSVPLTGGIESLGGSQDRLHRQQGVAVDDRHDHQPHQPARRWLSHPSRNFAGSSRSSSRPQRHTACPPRVRTSFTVTERPHHGCHGYTTLRDSVLWVLCCRVLQSRPSTFQFGARHSRSDEQLRCAVFHWPSDLCWPLCHCQTGARWSSTSTVSRQKPHEPTLAKSNRFCGGVRPDKADMFSGSQSHRRKTSGPLVAWVASGTETKPMKPTDQAILGMVSESPSRNALEPRGGLDKNIQLRRPTPLIRGEGKVLPTAYRASFRPYQDDKLGDSP